MSCTEVPRYGNSHGIFLGGRIQIFRFAQNDRTENQPNEEVQYKSLVISSG